MNLKQLPVLLILGVTPLASAGIYTESFEVAPPTTHYSWLNESPYGLKWDFYSGRAYSRLAGESITVLGDGHEGFIWGKNSVNTPAPLYGEPGSTYCDDNSTGYLVNAYGSGYGAEGKGNSWSIGVDFSNGPTRVYSLDFGYASGSNAPTHGVTVKGYSGGSKVWESSGTVAYGSLLTLNFSSTPVDRLEVVRTQNTTALFGGFSLGWYTMDNLQFDATGSFGEYKWTAGDGGMGSPVPEPATCALLGLGVVALVRRRRA